MDHSHPFPIPRNGPPSNFQLFKTFAVDHSRIYRYLCQSTWSYQFGETGRFAAPKLKEFQNKSIVSQSIVSQVILASTSESRWNRLCLVIEGVGFNYPVLEVIRFINV